MTPKEALQALLDGREALRCAAVELRLLEAKARHAADETDAALGRVYGVQEPRASK